MEKEGPTPEEHFLFDYSELRWKAVAHGAIASNDALMAGIMRRRLVSERDEEWLNSESAEARRRGDQIDAYIKELDAVIHNHFSDLAPPIQYREIRKNLWKGVTADLAAHTLDRTIDALRGRTDEPLLVTEIALDYFYSREGKEEGRHVTDLYVEGLLTYEELHTCMPTYDGLRMKTAWILKKLRRKLKGVLERNS